MSVVSGVTLICRELCEDELIVAALRRVPPGALFRAVDGRFGGSKHPQCSVLGAGINGLDEDAFAAAVMAFPWQLPENVVLIIQPEDGPTRVWRPWAPGQPLGANDKERYGAWEDFVGDDFGDLPTSPKPPPT